MHFHLIISHIIEFRKQVRRRILENKMFTNQKKQSNVNQKQRKSYTRYSRTVGKREQSTSLLAGIFPQKVIRKSKIINNEQKQEQDIKASVKQNKRQGVSLKFNRKRLKTDGNQYIRLQQKLQTIEQRINQLKQSLQRKRQQKQRRENLRIKIKQERKIKQLRKQQSLQSDIKSADKLQVFVSNQTPKERPKKPSFKSKLGGMVIQVPESDASPPLFNPYSPRNNIYYVSEILKGYQDEDSIIRQHLINSIQFLTVFRGFTPPDIKNKFLKLPVKKGYEGKITVIFDLDETLIHCNDDLYQKHELELPIKFPNGQQITAGINIRPGAIKLLEDLSSDFEIMIFTASHPCYANVVLDYLDPKKQHIHHRLYRQHCSLIPNGGPYVKDLRIINRDLKKMVLVDNAAYSYVFQPDNGIPIIPYYQGKNDYELDALKQYIYKLKLYDDVRALNRVTFKLNRYPYYEVDNIDQMVEQLYKNKGYDTSD